MSQYRRSLPARPDLEQQKKQAKELLQSFDAGDADARARIREELPDKQDLTLGDAQFVIAREYGFPDWASLKRHIDEQAGVAVSPIALIHDAVRRRDVKGVRRLFDQHAELRAYVNQPVFAFDSPAIVAFADDAMMVDVLLDYGADPNQKSTWWAGGFHALYSATGAAAERLLAAGAIPDACALAHLDRADELAAMIATNPACVHERGGDGQTPLHFAESRRVVDLLLTHGADIDARDVDHRSTAAEWMVRGTPGHNRTELARYLVSRGASADIFLAAALGLNDRVRALLDADPTLLDLRIGQGEYAEKPPGSYHIYFWTIGSGKSPMDVADQFGHRDTFEVMRGYASPRQQLLTACRRADEAQVNAIVRANPGILSTLTEDDQRLVTEAAWQGNARVMILMLKLGFDPRTPGHDSGTALHCAAWEGSVECVEALVRRPDARELVDIEDAHYRATPLGWCCHGSVHGNIRRDHARVAQLLLEAGADPGHGIRDASPSVTAVLRAWNGKSN